MKNQIRVAVTILVFMASFAKAQAQAQSQEVNPIPQISSQTTFTLTPYLWLPNYTPTLTGPNGNQAPSDGTTSLSAPLGYVSGGFMIAGEVHKERFGALVDFFNGTMKDVKQDNATEWRLTQTLFTAAGTYTLHQDKQAYVDALAGLRVLSVTGTMSRDRLQVFNDANRAFTLNSVDPIVGVKGRIRIADSSWFVPFYGDIGGGGKATLTWQANVGVGKAFKWGDISLGYRMLGYEMQKDAIGKVAGYTKAKMNMGAAVLSADVRF